MKKTILSFILIGIMAIAFNVVKADDPITWEKTFEDDFESYSTGKVELQDDFLTNWTNFRWNGSEPNASDINDVASIKKEGANSFVNLKYDGSFFFMAPHNLRANEFDVNLDFRSHDLTDAWIGINMRKEYRDIRYNGGTGMMIYFRTKYIENVDGDIIGEAVTISALRGGSLSTTDLGDLIEGERIYQYLYPESGIIDPTKQIKSNWINIKIKVSNTDNKNESVYAMYINDEYKASLTYARSSLNIHGYFGLHACTGDIDVDNFKIQSNDVLPPPPIIRVNRLVDSRGEVGKVFTFPGEAENDIELIDDADNKATIEVVLPNSEIIIIAEGVYTFTPTMAGIHTLRYTAENVNDDKSTLDFMINVAGEAVVDPDPVDPDPVDPDPVDPDTDTPNSETNSNSAPIIIGSVVAGVALIGVGVYFFVIKKRP